MNARTSREALIAEVLGDIDRLFDRLDKLQLEFNRAESNLNSTVAALETAGAKYRTAVAEFTEHAKSDLSQHFDNVAVKTVAEQKTALQEIARMAFRAEASNLQRVDKQQKLVRALSYVFTALISSCISGSIVYAICRA